MKNGAKDDRPRRVETGAAVGGHARLAPSARLLPDRYEAVSVTEREVPSAEAAQQRGLPPGRHARVPLSPDRRVPSNLLPRLLDQLAAADAQMLDGSGPGPFPNSGLVRMTQALARRF